MLFSSFDPAGDDWQPLRRYCHRPSGAAFSSSSSPSSTSSAPYALVTGSTGGMGEEWAYQLAAHGFNIILQGRNRAKLEAVRDEILQRRPNAHHAARGEVPDVRLLVTEATVWPNDALTKGLEALLAEPGLRLTIVINNLGINSVHYPRLEQQSREEVEEIVIANSLFPLEVSRLTLAQLKQNQPSLSVTITSMAWKNPPP